jgi:uracil-DNA glycosylase
VPCVFEVITVHCNNTEADMPPIQNNPSRQLGQLLVQIRACDCCATELPLGARPILRASTTARILIVGQAPGLQVHETGIPWNDPSGDRLRNWMGIDRDIFYDASRIAIMPMGLCYPGRNPRGGDLPPRSECAPRWFDKVLALLPEIQFTLLAGAYGQRWYLGNSVRKTVTETVRSWQEYVPDYLPLPHPSYRNNLWLKQNPWFEQEVLPYLKNRMREIIF